jgi:hypothetical protein
MTQPCTCPHSASPQLHCPWVDAPPLPRTLPPDAPHLLPAHLWTSLAPCLRTHVRHTLCRILEEVLNDRPRP